MWGEFTSTATTTETQQWKCLISKEEMDELCTASETIDPEIGFGYIKKQKEFSHHLAASHFTLDPLIAHNIDLLKCIKKCKEFLNMLQYSRHEYEEHVVPSLPSVPFQRQKHPLVEVSAEGAKQLLDRAVYHTCAHAGFDSTTNSAMEVLVDLVGDYLSKLTLLLRQNVEREDLNLSVGFPDALERTCHDIGLGSVRNLFHYHKSLLSYNRLLQKECDTLRAECLSTLRQYQSEAHFNSLQNDTWNEGESEWSCSDEPSKSTVERKTSVPSLRYLLGDSEVELDTEDDGITGSQLHLENAPPGVLENEMQMLNTLEEQEAQAGSNKV